MRSPSEEVRCSSSSSLRMEERLCWISLKDFNETDYSQPRSIRKLWQWKDTVLGNGHDYFVPRPNAIQSIQNAIQNTNYMTEENRMIIQHCSVMSNCARLDILLQVHTNNTTTTTNDVLKHVARVLSHQLSLSTTTTTTSSWKEMIGNALDLPGMVRTFDSSSSSSSGREEEQVVIQEISSQLQMNWNITEIITHYCEVASGLAHRPNRPTRKVQFRPYSSRDAHILLQLKRTLALCHSSRLAQVYKIALTCGKAMRSDPYFQPLRPYSNSNTKIPSTLHTNMTTYAHQTILQPIVQKESMRFLQINPIIAFQQQLQTDLPHIHRNDLTNKEIKSILHSIYHQLRTTQQPLSSTQYEQLLSQIKQQQNVIRNNNK